MNGKILDSKQLIGSLAVSLGTILTGVFAYLFNVIIGRSLGPGHFGEIATVVYILTLVTSFGGVVQTIVTRYTSEFHAKQELFSLRRNYRKFSLFMLYVGICLVVLIIIIVPVLTRFFSLSDRISSAIALTSIVFALLMTVNRGALQGLQYFTRLSVVNVLEVVAKVAIAYVLIRMSFGLKGAATAILLAPVVAYIMSYIFLQKDMKGTEGGVELKEVPLNRKELLRYSLPIAWGMILLSLLYSIDVFVMKKFFSSVESGQYIAVSQVAKIILYLGIPIAGVMFPIITQQRITGEKHYKTLGLAVTLTLVVIGILLVFYKFYSAILIQKMWGEQFKEGSYLLLSSSVLAAIITMINLFVNYYLSIKNYNFLWALTLFTAVQFQMVMRNHQTINLVLEELRLANGLLLTALVLYYLFIKRAQLKTVFIRGK